MTFYSKIRRRPHVTQRLKDHANDHGSAAARTPRARRSLAFGAAVLIGAAVLGGSGGAGAAGLLTGKNIRDDSLRSADFRDNTIGGVKVRNGGLSQSDVSFDLTGDQGVPGVEGNPGLPGIRAIRLRTGNPQSRTDLDAITAIANCGPGEITLSGGAQLDGADPGVLPYILSSGSVGLVTWTTNIGFATTSGGSATYTPWVVCALVS
jgi:hypothetical protein